MGQNSTLTLPAKAWLVLLGVVLTAAGLFFAIVGGKLAMLGGSLYFVVAGVLLVLSGLLVIARRPLGGLLFALAYAGTVVWALWEVGLDFWPLNSRLFAITIGAVVVALSYPLLRRNGGLSPMRGISYGLAFVLAIVAAGFGGGMFMPHPTVSASGPAPALVKVK